MPRFYFDLRENGTLIEDEEGMEVADVSAAETEAVKTAVEMARDRLPGSKLSSITIDVRDRNGDHVLTATATLEVKRASRPTRGKGRSRSGDTGEGTGPP